MVAPQERPGVEDLAADEPLRHVQTKLAILSGGELPLSEENVPPSGSRDHPVEPPSIGEIGDRNVLSTEVLYELCGYLHVADHDELRHVHHA